MEAQQAELGGQVQALDSEKRKEVSQVQHEIKKLEEDIEGLKNKMRSKENNPFFVQVNQFFAEVKDYIDQYHALSLQSQGSREHKKELFALQRALADVEYEASQRELAIKKRLDDDLRKHKDDLDRSFAARFQEEVEAEKMRVQGMTDRKQAYEQQLVQSIGLIQEAKERQMALTETRDLQRTQGLGAREAKVRQVNQELEEIKAS